MPRVAFETISGPPALADVPLGARLVDLCDARGVLVPFSCRSASCGTCRIDILEGAEHLAPPADDELDILDIFGDDPARRRLACQARITPGDGLVRIRPVNDAQG